jgi:tRNA-splicing ligase RtcB
MVAIQQLKQISDFVWEIPVGFQEGMKIPVRIFASRQLLESAMGDKSLQQAINATYLPGLVGFVAVMPDVHQGYGFPIGGVAASDVRIGVISPGGIGYDINCGVRLLSSNIEFGAAKPYLPDLAAALYQYCPTGVGSKGDIRLTGSQLDKVLSDGSEWVLKAGYATRQDLERTEAGGRLPEADASKVSARAKDRGRPQLGTLGAGNHFIEIGLIEQVFDREAADVMGLQEGYLTLMIHCGSRGLGHQVCSDYVQSFQGAVKRYNIKLPDRELVCAPLSSPEGKDYLAGMSAAANYAFANRQVLTHLARQAFEEVLAGRVKDWGLYQVYDIAHNIGKIETHQFDGKNIKVCVHRKGATRAFGPGMPGVPADFQKIGQPVLVPGSMGTASWVLAATAESMTESIGSCCHGAGRVMSRSKAKKSIRGEKLVQELSHDGILVKAGSMPGLAEEAPEAYKDVDQVIKTVVGAGIARKVARLTPLVVIKG